VPPRHHSIRAAFDATWQRLDAAERAVFAALSVFRGGFTREAASAVAGATLGQLRELTLKSLLQPDRRHLLPHNRFVIHELLRQYGALMLPERPGGAGRAHALHCTYFCAWLAARLEPINGPQQRQAADDIAEELDNVRAAWQWAVEQVDLDAIHEAATTLFLFCQLRSHFLDGAEMMAAAAAALRTLAASHLRDLTLAQLLNHEGWLRIRLGDFARAAAVLAESRALYSRPDVPPPPAYMGTDPTPPLAIVAHIRGDHAAALALGEEALQAATARGDRYNQSYAHYALTSAHAGHGDYTAAAYHAQQACALAEAVGNRWFLAILRNEWGKVARAVEDYAQAGEHFRTSYAIKAAFDDPEGMAVALNHLGEIAILQHDLAEAGRLHRQALAIYEGIGDRVGLATALRGLAQVAGAQGATAEAWRGYGEALAIAEDTQFLPLVFAILVDLGALLLQRGGVVSGLQALLQVRQHAAADHEMRTRAEHCLAAWQDQVDPALYAAALQNTRQTDLAATLRVLQAAFGVPGRSDAAT
jgi:tetratricopeptide (TPR) repeat protein